MRYEQFSVNELTVNKIFNEYGQDITPGANPSGALDYFVDINRAGPGNGLSWDGAFKTIAAAVTASNLSIGSTPNRWWARRNRIFVAGDEITEDITVLPEKTDIIGVGTDLRPFPRIFGQHTVVAAKVGCRFINMGFNSNATGVLMTIPAGSHGFGMLGCTLTASAAGVTKGLMITNCAHVGINDNNFVLGAGAVANIFGLAISAEGLASMHDWKIRRNHITATLGIHIVEATANTYGGLIDSNIIRATGKAINDASDKFQVVNNRWMTDIDTGTSTAGFTFNLQLAAGNIQMGVTGLGDHVPFLKIAES
jgi:hypothetical protein